MHYCGQQFGRGREEGDDCFGRFTLLLREQLSKSDHEIRQIIYNGAPLIETEQVWMPVLKAHHHVLLQRGAGISGAEAVVTHAIVGQYEWDLVNLYVELDGT